MVRKVGQIVGCGRRTWLARVYNGLDPETKKRKYLNQTIHGGLRDAQAHFNKMLVERDRGRNLDSSRQTLNQFLDRWITRPARFQASRSSAPGPTAPNELHPDPRARSAFVSWSRFGADRRRTLSCYARRGFADQVQQRFRITPLRPQTAPPPYEQ